MELYLNIGTIIISASFALLYIFIDIFIEQLKNKDKNISRTKGMIAYRS